MKKEEKTVDSLYIQQHLANERTYLAWIRTALTIMGIGYLSAKLHFLSRFYPLEINDTVAQVIGFVSITIGLVTTVYATVSYLKKRKKPLIANPFKRRWGV
jgi:putative membrane protein